MNSLLNIVLFEPEIPPNTGNIIRLSANMGAQLHLIEPVGFELDDKRLRRAGLDYGEWKDMQVHKNWDDFLKTTQPENLYAITTRGKTRHVDTEFKPGDYVVFGPETRGLPQDILDSLEPEKTVRIPMQANSRSMNLSNSVAVIAFEVLRQLDFPGAE